MRKGARARGEVRVRIGPAVLDIVEADIEEYGRFEAEKETILVRKGMSDYVRSRTELHEILHAIWEEYDLPRDHEETCVRRLESGLVAFFIDNPEYGKKLISTLIKAKEV
jgi:hypothetical protein